MSFFEWSARVPIIFHAPERFAPRRENTPVSLVDLLPTITETVLNGQSPIYAAPIDGQSLLPLLTGNGTIYNEMLSEGVIAPLLMIRRGRFKHTLYVK